MAQMTIDRFENVLRMMESTDIENRSVALGILEQLDYSENLAFILLCKKHGAASAHEWEQQAPNLYKKLAAIPGMDMNRAITYKTALHHLKAMNAPVAQIQFFLDEFSRYLVRQLQSMGYDFIEDLEIRMKIKDHDQIGKFSESH